MAAAPHIPPLFALWAWFPIGLFFFYRCKVRVAILITLVAGWAVLPTANFVPTDAEFPYWIMSASLPAGYFLTKATITGLTALAGVMIFDWRGVRRFRPSGWDLPMALWCAVPVLSGMANHGAYQGALREGLRGAVYQLLAWGVPYLLGRLYFADDAGLELAAKAFATAGLCYVPICLAEVIAGPEFYAHVYGYQPYRWLGAARYIGFRPIGFLEDGNQLGIWMAAATLLATGLWRYGRGRRVLGLPIGWAALALLVVTVLCQSGGSIILMICLLPFILIHRGAFRRRVAVALALIVLCFAGLRLSNVISLRWMVDNTRPAREVEMFFYRIGRQSFTWRLAQDERHVRTALERPITGWGRWDWWRNGENRPWGLWLLAYGMYGGVGLAALETLQLLPVVKSAWVGEMHGEVQDESSMEGGGVSPDLRIAFGAVLLLTAIDNLLNSGMILPFVLAIGGMSAGVAMSADKRNSDEPAIEADATIGG